LSNGTAAKRTSSLKGIYYALSAFFLWGFLPVYWKLLGEFTAAQILANRIILSSFFVFALLYQRKQMGEVKSVLFNRRKLLLVMLSSMVISVNWFVYIWAVNSNHVIEASMGYYINPLIVILIGTFFLKEKINRMEMTAILFALSGVLIITFQYGRFPWISLVLAISFSLYGLCKKLVQVDSLVALGIETLLLTPIAAAFLIINHQHFRSIAINVAPITILLLLISGMLTALPLLWFARAAKLVNLSVLGFSQFLSPTISLLLGIFLFREAFTFSHAVSFGLIWTGLAVFTYAQSLKFKAMNAKRIHI
jgi:chloramphenicol-sensitive protein RarD